MLIRSDRCALCGAARETLDDAVIVACLYCGAVVAIDVRQAQHPALCARQLRALVAPSMAEARRLRLGAEMERAAHAQDRRLWRTLAAEQYPLAAVTSREWIGPEAEDPRRLTHWVSGAMRLGELQAFDGAIRSLQAKYAAACGGLLRARDPVEAARALLDAARGLYLAFDRHPDVPPGTLRGGPEQHARMAARTAVASYASALGPGIAARIYVEVLGDVQVAPGEARCTRCGGPFEAVQGLVRCRWCRAVAEVEVEDPWLSAALRQWEAWLATAQAQDPRRDYEVALAALQTISFATHAGGAVVTPEQAAAFLGRAVPWIPRSELHRAIELLVDGQQDEHAALLRAVRAATGGWLARAEARPAPRVRQAHGPTSAEAGEAWIEQNLAFWSYSGIDAQRDPELAVNTLLGLCTSSFALARQAGVSSPLTAEVALRFLERAWPAYDRASMRTLARVLADGHDDPELKALLTGLAAALGA